jgi:DNA primase
LLWGTAGARARAYLAGRGLADETLRQFGLGYAPTGNGLLHYLDHDGFTEQELQAAGVIGVADDGRQYDFFRDRVLFPIRDVQGRTIAFGGRSLDDAQQPKYLNSRDTLLFHKQETLFAFDLARPAMAQERQAVIVEGYMDAAMAHQFGYRNVVATLGTAVTDRHLRQLRRQVDEIVLALDADAAGQAATWRTLQVADESLRAGYTPVVAPARRAQRLVADRAVRLRVLALPNAKDPDELIRTDAAVWPSLVKRALPVIDFVLQRLEARHDLASAQGKAAAAEEIADVLAGIASPIEQDHYTNEVAQRLHVEPGAVRRLLRGKSSRVSPAPHPPGPLAPTVARGDALDDYMLALLTRARAVPDAAPVEAPEFILAESQELYRHLGGEIPPALEPYAERVRRRLPDVERLSPGALERQMIETQLTIKKARLTQRQKSIRALGDDAEIGGLVSQLVELAQAIGAIDEELRAEREKAGAR